MGDGFHPHPAGTLRLFLIGARTRDCCGWGQPVHAAFDGVILEAVDSVAERQWLYVVRESWFAVKNTLVFARRGLDPARLAGNHVIMGTAGTYALYAHLAPGTRRLGIGDHAPAARSQLTARRSARDRWRRVSHARDVVLSAGR